MEEWFGKVWHNIVAKQDDSEHQSEKVTFKSISKELRLMYHLMGGVQTKTLYATDKTSRLSLRSVMQKMTGEKAQFSISWQDKKGVYLPEEIALFPTQELNKLFYVWLVAMAAYANVSALNWAEENYRVQVHLLKRYPGFKKKFAQMLSIVFEQREKLVRKHHLSKEDELAFKAFVSEGISAEIDSKEIYPFPLWLYPSPSRITHHENVELDDEDETDTQKKDTETESLDVRKNASRTEDDSETDGFMAFLPEGLMSISERINVDRSEDDSDDADAAFNAKDLDELTLGKKKKGLASKLKIDLELPTEEIDNYAVGEGIYIDEWDYTKEQYLKNYCLLTPIYRESEQDKELDGHIRRLSDKVKKEFSTFAFHRTKESHLPYGQELNLDSWISYASSTNKDSEKQNFFENVVKKQRDLSTLILADISLSTEAAVTTELSILDIIKESLFVFADSLDALGDPLAMYAFSSVKNTKVRYHVLKNFNEDYSAQIRGRIDDLRAGYYTRLGTAIRQSTRILQKQPTHNKLMLIISDGKPNDIDKYEGRYGVEDTKKAIYEAHKAGVIPFCITVDSESNSYLPQIFGKEGYTYIRDIRKLPSALPQIYMNLTQ